MNIWVTHEPSPVIAVSEPEPIQINVTHHRVYLSVVDYEQQGVSAT